MKLPTILCASRTASSSGGHAPPAILAASAKCQKVALWHSAPFGTWHFGTQLRLALGTLALSSVWHLALWHSTPSGTWHFGTQLRLALGTLALDSCFGAWHFGTRDTRSGALHETESCSSVKSSPCTNE